jgi:virginiamycin A acetyltransferase
MKIGIIIPTYQKSDGTTPLLIKRAIKSIKSQKHQDFSLIIIGDKYEDNNEFENICNDKDLKGKIYYKNLPFAKERDKYPIGSKELWSAGGVNARNYGIDWGLKLGLSYMCHLDHDDYWHPQHLEIINYVIESTNNPAVIATCSTHFDSHHPNIKLDNEVIPLKVKAGCVIHSSACINHKLIPLRYRDVFEETKKEHAADADMWDRIGEYSVKNQLNSYLITSLTCFHPTEGSILNQQSQKMNKNNLIPRGKHTYGPEPKIMGVKELAMGSSIGKFCSIADNLQFIVKGTHMMNWVTTYPFQEVWNLKNIPLNKINGIETKAGDPIPPELASPITIGNDVWIASNVKIKQGVTIGDGAVLATECFVTKDVPPYAIVGGNPAKIIKYRHTEEQIKKLLELKWWDFSDNNILNLTPLLASDKVDEFIEEAFKIKNK